MSSKKIKLLESAQKNILKGQLDRAVAEYRQIIELEPSDVRHRQKIAELLTKTRRYDEAIKEYTIIAKNYISADYYLKAIAVYKQIQKLDPLNPDIALTLASLNEKQGMIGNAVAEYSAVVQLYEKTGENLKALKALENILALDADNSAVKLRIAEKYFTVGAEDTSFDAFISLLQGLREKNDDKGFNLIAERAGTLFGKRIHTALAATSDSDAAAVLADTIEADSSISPQIADLPPENCSADFQANQVQPDAIEIIESAPLEEIEYLEDILPLDAAEQIEETAWPDDSGDWEEEIELPSPDVPAAAAATGGEAADQDVIEELDIVDELDEIELEMEIDHDLSIEPAPFFDSSVSMADEEFDFGKDMSQFAEEIDFELFANHEQGTAFDSANSGYTRGELENEDAESHYSLGLAYKEMGLWDEALAEFTVASHSTEREIDALILAGVCLREMGNIAKAVEIFEDTLKHEDITEDESFGIQYERALCYETSGDFAMARSLLTGIVTVRPTFSDVAERLKNLPT